MKILELTLKRKWYDMILSGEKREEYREIKPYWDRRLYNDGTYCKDYDYVHFRNGYSLDAPDFYIQFKSIKIAKGKPEWGAIEEKLYYVIELGMVVPNPKIVLRGIEGLSWRDLE